MGLRNLEIERSYYTERDPYKLINNFYIPTLKETKNYYRVAGYFSSTALSIAAEGIAGLIENEGKMRLLISPELSEKDIDVICNQGLIDEEMELFDGLDIEQWLLDDNLRALSWLLSRDLLEIKIVVNTKVAESLFHQKFGIMIDGNGDAISFSGSINETAKAWLTNIEEFKVFKSWELGQSEYYEDDLNKFTKYWNTTKTDHISVFNLPEAVRKGLLKLAPKDVKDLNLMRKFKKEKKVNKTRLSLFDHQIEAVNMWINNDYKLLNVMATGTGKTRTAIGCLDYLLKENKRFVAIVSTPQNPLTNQWYKDIMELGIPFDKIQRITSGNKWTKKLQEILLDIQLESYNNAVLLTTHRLSSDEKFIKIIKENVGNYELFYICDECHAIGSTKQRDALIDEYNYRLGLSATPERMFDESGTSLIFKYFGNKTFEFGIYEALHTINPITNRPYLNKFNYVPIFVYLNDKETKDYNKLSLQIYLNEKKLEEEYSKELEDKIVGLKILRSRITKNAFNKYNSYSGLLDDLISKGNTYDLITFVSDAQMSNSMKIAKEKKLFVAKITENEGTKIKSGQTKSERDQIIQNFRDRKLNMLFGQKCLDEGIDIKNARIAILMSSSVNPREFVQRVGRVIRDAPNKEISYIYDFIVLPSVVDEDNIQVIVKRIALKEAARTMKIAGNAENYEEVIQMYRDRGIDLNEH